MPYDRTAYFEQRAAGRRGGGASPGITGPEATVDAAGLQAAASEENAARAAGEIRGTGTLTHYRPTGGWRSPGPGGGGGGGGGAEPSLTDASLGAPTSYAGGAGAPAPVEVMRGNKTSYVNAAPEGSEGAPGTGTKEFGTLQQAGQAYNRGTAAPDTPEGTYVPPEGPKLQAAAAADVTGAKALHTGQAKVQEGVATAEKLGVANTAFRTNFVDEHGVIDPKTKQLGLPADENLQRIYKKGVYHVSQGSSPEEAYTKIAPELYSHYYTPDNVDKALNLISKQTGQPITPERRAKALEGSPEAKAQLYPYIQQSLRAPKPGFWGSVPRNVTAPNQAMTP
jgi:hypothetical protein